MSMRCVTVTAGLLAAALLTTPAWAGMPLVTHAADSSVPGMT